jgi:superfamily II DNA or RNA helicase
MQCGPIRHAIAATPSTGRHLVVHETTFNTEESGADGPSIQAIYTELAADDTRNSLIVEQVVRAAGDGRRSLVLTNRLDHLEALTNSVRSRTEAPVLSLHGRLAPADRRALRDRLRMLDEARAPFVLVAIDKVAGEGIDLPSLNTLFLAVVVGHPLSSPAYCDSETSPSPPRGELVYSLTVM